MKKCYIKFIKFIWDIKIYEVLVIILGGNIIWRYLEY